MSTIDNVIDSIESPSTTGQPIQAEVKNAAVVLGYSSGNSWPTYKPYVEARPDLDKRNRVIPITLTCDGFGHVYDIEDGGGHVGNIGIFMHNATNVWKTPERWGLPWLYTFASAVEAMVDAARGFGYEQGKDYYVWAAHPNSKYGKHVCSPGLCGYPRADGTQHLFHSDYDASILNTYMLHDAAPPKPPNPYALFPTDIGDHRFPNHGNERLTVEQTDGALVHPVKYRNYLKHQLRGEVLMFRNRCMRVAKYEPPSYTKLRPKPVWADGRHLGHRWQALNRRVEKIDALP